MGEKVRSFVAIELPDALKLELGKMIDALDAVDIPGIRPVRPEGVHLTLKFLGDVDSERIDTVSKALSVAVSAHSTLRLALGEAGAFPNLRRPRVLWVGMDGDMEALALLQRGVEEALTSVGFVEDSRGYNPHLTLARVRNGSPASAGRRAADVLTETAYQRGVDFQVERVSLMRTTLHPEGAVHQRLVSAPLKGGYRNLM